MRTLESIQLIRIDGAQACSTIAANLPFRLSFIADKMVTRIKNQFTELSYPKFSFRALGIILVGFILVACNPQESEPITPTRTETIPTVSASSQVTDTISPTQAPQITPIQPQTLVVLVAPPQADVGLVDQLEAILSELSTSAGLDFEVRQDITPQDLSSTLRLVVVVPPDPGLGNLAQAAPNIQFLGVYIPGLEPAPNLSVIDTQDLSPGTIGFLAGYLAAVVTPEWRVGAISLSDTSQGIDSRQGFLNGVVFFCGLCRQTYPPFYTYPMYVEASSGSTSQEWQAAADLLIDRAVLTAYVAPGVGDDDLLEYLATAGINLIGTRTPPPGTNDRWIATITGDISASVRSAWPDLISGKGGAWISPPLAIMDVNPNLLSPGRQRLVDNLVAELTSGFIDTGLEATPSPP